MKICEKNIKKQKRKCKKKQKCKNRTYAIQKVRE